MGNVASEIKVHSLRLLAFRHEKMLPSAVIVEATIRSAKLERDEHPAHAFPSAPPENPHPHSKRRTATVASKNRRATAPASLPLHRSRSIVGRKYASQNHISNRNWLKNRTHRKQTTKPSLTETRIASLSGLPRAILATGSHCRIEFLPGGQNIECDVTYSKQTTARFLPGARTACCHSPKRTARGICSVFSNHQLPMRRASASRARSATRGICFAFSNRELDLLEHHLNHRKQTTATRSNRELSTIQNSTFHRLQTAPSDFVARWLNVRRSLDVKRTLNPKITGGAQRSPLAGQSTPIRRDSPGSSAT